MRPRYRFTAGVFGLALVATISARPGDPVLEPPVPRGCQRGTFIEIALAGADFGEPLAVWFGAAGRGTLSPGATIGKDSTKFLTARVEIPADTPVGLYRLRLASYGGLSNLRAFCVDGLPELPESGRHHTPAAARQIPVPSVVSGHTAEESGDFYRISAAAAQRVSFEVLGRRLGSPIDPLVRLYDAEGHELPRAYSNDAPGLQGDARLSHTFTTSGDYLVEVRDTRHRGGRDFNYRLRIGDFPCAVAPLPAAAKRGSKLVVRFAGPQVDGVAPIVIQVPTDPSVEAIGVTPVGASGLPGWPVTLMLSDHEELMAADGISALAQAQRLVPPCGVTGRFLHKGQKDHFSITAKKGERFHIAAQTAELHSPSEVYVTVRDGGGNELGHTDPHREPAIDFTAPADGNFFIVVEHLNYEFGPSEVYRLTVTPPVAGFELSTVNDRVAVPQGQVALIPISTLVRHDFGGPIELSVVGPPGLSGKVAVPAGVQAVPVTPTPGMEKAPPVSPVAQLPIHAAGNLPPGIYEIKVLAKATADTKELMAYASTKAAVQSQMGGLAFPPREWLRSIAVAVTPKPPFTLAALWERPDAVRGRGDTLVVVATRDAGFEGDIQLSIVGLPYGVSSSMGAIRRGRAESAVELTVTDKAALGSFPFTVIGRARQDGHEYTATLIPPPLIVSVPFELAVTPNPLSLEPGGKATLTVTATRKGGYGGPIALEPRNLPARLTAGRASIDAGKNTATIRLVAEADAPLGSRGDVDVLGSAAPGNQQAASPPFAIRVQAPPPRLVVKLEPSAITLKPGGKTKIKVTVERKNFTGPVAITIEGLPAKVTTAAANIPPDQSTAEIDLTAAADAEPANTEATVTAKATAAATAKVNVRVEK
jgi:hypothetical protein